jgi:Kef-type K+ transport system membrane component KefB
LIFAQMGLATQSISPALYSAITLMVLVTTFLAPPLLSRAAPPRRDEAAVDDSGIDNLVAGDWRHTPPSTRKTGD